MIEMVREWFGEGLLPSSSTSSTQRHLLRISSPPSLPLSLSNPESQYAMYASMLDPMDWLVDSTPFLSRSRMERDESYATCPNTLDTQARLTEIGCVFDWGVSVYACLFLLCVLVSSLRVRFSCNFWVSPSRLLPVNVWRTCKPQHAPLHMGWRRACSQTEHLARPLHR
ncbi:hypothetical protein IE53DRAFT_72785 [Violaceomyces palustris]|uniref:Uncharacterized protein n=1 Tax=Violaceomyces palustris TaxID=1673888 RepID=A0ACD0NYQ1_9BASI|nr:hypothetical protein IE53DRAFT_72785 [Violaceomyces palustris]